MPEAGVAKLQSYDWPGNIRELRNVIEGATIVARGHALEFDLPVSMTAPPFTPTVLEINETAQTAFSNGTRDQRREREYLNSYTFRRIIVWPKYRTMVSPSRPLLTH